MGGELLMQEDGESVKSDWMCKRKFPRTDEVQKGKKLE
jgi:hypothetical protein